MLILFSFAAISFAQQKALFPIEKNGKTGYIDATGKVVIAPRFEAGWPFSEGMAPVQVGGDWGYIDETGRIVIEPVFFSAGSFREGIADVGVYPKGRKSIDGKVGYYQYIDRTGKPISDEKYEITFDFSEGFAHVVNAENKQGFIDRSGRMVIPQRSQGNKVSNGRILFRTQGNMPDSRAGYYDISGKIVIDPVFSYGKEFSEGLACVDTEKGTGFIDVSGKFVIEPKFVRCLDFTDGLAGVYIEQDDKTAGWGFIDRAGSIVISPRFAEIERFSDNVAVVRPYDYGTDSGVGRSGVIDRAGKMIIPAQYPYIGQFKNGLAYVNLTDEYIVHGTPDRWGYINKGGKLVWQNK